MCIFAKLSSWRRVEAIWYRTSMIESALTPVVADRIWSLERPVWFSGARLRARTTVVRLDDGSLLLHTPAPPSDALAEELRALGPVRWLVVPNCWHHLGAPAAAARFPDATLVGPASALRRNGALRLDLDFQDGQLGGLLPEVEVLPLAGVPFWDETVLYHRPTQTLLGADLRALRLAREGAAVVGCDIDRRGLDDTGARLAEAGVGATLLERARRRRTASSSSGSCSTLRARPL